MSDGSRRRTLAGVAATIAIGVGAGAVAQQRDMLAGLRDAVKPLVVAGKSRDETIAAKPTAKWDAKWGGGFMKPDLFAGIVWDDLSRAVKK